MTLGGFSHFLPRGKIPVLLPLILCFFPLGILFWEHQGSRNNETREADQALQQRLQPLAEKLRRQANQEYWPGLFLNRFKAQTESLLRRNPDRMLPQKAPGLLAASRFKAMPPTQIWFAWFPGGDLQKPPQLCSGEGFSTNNRILFSGLLHEIARRLSGLPNTLNGATWESRLAGLLGFGISPALFSQEFRGVPFPVIFNKKFHFCVWNTISVNGKVFGAALVLMDMKFGKKDPEIHTLLANWNHKGIFPAFLPLPVEFGKSRRRSILHPRLPKSETLAIRLAVRAEMQIMEPDPKFDRVGRVKLPFSKIGVLDRKGDWRFLLVNLGPESRFLGLLLCRFPDKTLSVPQKLGSLWLAACLIFWGGVYGFFKGAGRLPDVGVRDSLILWFALLIAVPIALFANTSFSLLRDRERNLEEYLRRQISAVLGDLEAGSGGIIPNQEKSLEAFFQSPETLAELDNLRMNRPDPQPFFSRTWKKLEGLGIIPKTMVVYGPGGFVLMKNEMNLPTQSRNVFETILERSWFQEHQEKFEAMPASGAKPVSDSSSGVLKMMSFTQDAIKLGSIVNRIERFWIGSNQLMTINSLIWRKARVAYSVGLLWNNDFSIRSYIEKRVPELKLPEEGFDIAVFHKDPDGLALVKARGDSADLKSIGLKAGETSISRRMTFRGNPALTVAYPSQRLPNYVLVGRGDMTKIFMETRRLTGLLLILLGAAISLVFLTVLALSRSLAQPIIKMSHGLKAISEGNLSVTVSEPRTDELGEAGRILDQMTASLKERRRLTPFVSPQVMEIVGQGNIQRVIDGRQQELTILVTDIRNFTTISESHPPNMVFRALNEHLAAMARILRPFGGVIDRFVGDAIIAAFYPAPGLHHSVRAVLAAHRMTEAHRELMEDRHQKGLFSYAIGVGIETGEVVTGITGTDDVRLDLTALGDPLSRAHELEAKSKKGTRTRIVVSNRVKELASAKFQFRSLDEDWELEQSLETAPAFIPADPHFVESRPMEEQPSSQKPGYKPPFSTEPPTGDEKAKKFFLPFWVAGGLWLLPVLILLLGLENLREADSQRNLEKTRQMLTDDRNFFEKALDQNFCGEMALYRSISNALTQASLASESRQAFLRALKQGFETTASGIPEISWDFAYVTPPPRLGSASFSRLHLETTAGQGSGSGTLWTGEDIGTVPFPGRHSIDSGEGQIQASGLNLWGFHEAGYFLHTPWADEGTLTVKLDGFSGSLPYGKIALMVRQDVASAAPNFAITQWMNGTNWLSYRIEAASSTYGGILPGKAPWLRLARKGPLFRVSLSNDGRSWKTYGPYAIFPGKTLLAGLFYQPRFDPLIPANYGISLSPVPTRHISANQEYAKNLAHGAFGAILLRNFAYSEISEDLYDLYYTKFPKWQREPKLTTRTLFDQSLGRFREIREGDGKALFFWLPVWKKDFVLKEGLLEDSLHQRSTRSLWTESLPETAMNFYQELEGILLLQVRPEKTNPEPRLLETLRAGYERRGGIMTARTLDSPPRPLLPSSGSDTWIWDKLPSGSEFDWVRKGDFLIRSVIPDPKKGVQILFSRMIGNTPIVSQVRVWGWIICFFWLVAGFWFLFRVFWLSRIPALSLKFQLSGVFLTAILPTLLIGFLIIAQAQVENEARLESDHLSFLEKTCRSIDEGYQICQAFSQSLLTHYFRRKDLLEKLDRLPREKTAFLGPATRFLEGLFHGITRHGFQIRTVNLYSVYLNSAVFPYEKQAGRVNPMAQILGFVCYSIGKLLSPESIQLDEKQGGAKASDLLVLGTEFEEFQKSLVLFLGVGNFLRMIQAPFYFGNFLMGVDAADFFFRKTVQIHGKPRFDLQALWRLPNLEQHLFDGFEGLNDPLQGRNPFRVVFSGKLVPSQFLTPPYFRFRPDQGDKEEYSSQNLPTDLAPYASLAAKTKEPLRIFMGNQGSERITQFFPGVLLDRWLVTLEVNLTKLFEPILEASRQKRLMLLLIMLACMFLAGRVTSRFLRPIENLREAADLITQGNYKSRMEQGFSGEFGVLAKAFNQMASEAQEGKLLGQFVSESVRIVTRQTQEPGLNLTGEQQEVVVLFSALGGFKEALYQHDPVEMIESLNRFLQTMSPIIRNHGGEIDKFIGEKILAVFRTPAGDTRGETASRALQAAIEMRGAMSGVHTSFPLRLGIGLVAGPVLAGILGAEEVRLEYTVIGDTVNLASRLADMAIALPKGRTILDERLAADLLGKGGSAPPIRPLATTTVKGKKREIQVFELV